MAIPVKIASGMIHFFPKQPLFQKQGNPSALDQCREQLAEFEAAILENSELLIDYEAERQEEKDILAQNELNLEQDLKEMMGKFTHDAAYHGIPITVQKLDAIAECRAQYKDVIANSKNYIQGCDENIAICRENIEGAQNALTKANAAIEALLKGKVVIPSKDSLRTTSPESDSDGMHSSFDGADSSDGEHSASSSPRFVRSRSMPNLFQPYSDDSDLPSSSLTSPQLGRK